MRTNKLSMSPEEQARMEYTNSMTTKQEAAVRYVQNSLTKELQEVDDKTLAIFCIALFQEWEPGTFKVGDIRTDGKTPYECIIEHDSILNPDFDLSVRTLWKPYHSREAEWALPWIAPTGAHDMYKAGEYMIWTDGTTYYCKTDTNFSPEEYSAAWEQVN